ncbi:uncharacterized protein LOC143476104 isoform X1 [Brachyhypopomus gauderio]|uniref:uncharacterized protein LOC143476104 isoform X1 n=1 Tax=Brachyhypopomus gauderio TaxID=698409 RepID=UPI0040429988
MPSLAPSPRAGIPLRRNRFSQRIASSVQWNGSSTGQCPRLIHIPGHPGSTRTSQVLGARYWWPGMHRDVMRHVVSCAECARSKVPRTPPAGPDVCLLPPCMSFASWLLWIGCPPPKTHNPAFKRPSNRQDEEIILQIGSQYWKQNARKILAVTERDFQSLQGTKRKRMGRKDEETSALGDVTEKIEELLLASQGLDTVTATIRELSELALTNSNMVILTSAQSKTIKDALSCAVCKGPMVVPMFAVCCQSLIGCKLCIEEWLRTSTQCLRCRAENFASHVHVVLGLCDVLLALRDAFGDD